MGSTKVNVMDVSAPVGKLNDDKSIFVVWMIKDQNCSFIDRIFSSKDLLLVAKYFQSSEFLVRKVFFAECKAASIAAEDK